MGNELDLLGKGGGRSVGNRRPSNLRSNMPKIVLVIASEMVLRTLQMGVDLITGKLKATA